jgi:hypothetical protein
MKLSQLTITKSLRSEYKCSPPAHKVLADRIAARAGAAPASGERIGYVYIQAPAGQVAAKTQGERVETPEFIVANGLKPDAEYYINHQLYNPLAQLFGLMVEKMPGFVAPTWATDPDKLIGQREVLAGDLLFREGLGACQNLAKRQFVAKMFGSSTQSPKALVKTTQRPALNVRKAPMDESLAAAEAEAFGSGNGASPKVAMTPKKQTLISAFAIDTACFMDERMVNSMKAIKSAKKKKDKVNEPGTG